MSRQKVTREAAGQYDADGLAPARGVRGSGAGREAFARWLRTATLLAATSLLSSCALLGKGEPIQVLDPSAKVAPAAEWPQASWSLLVLRPLASQSLDTERIVVRPAPGAVQVYKGAAWSDTAPDLVQTSLLSAFEDSGRILSVARPGGALRGEFQLATELRAFESVYAGDSPSAVIELHARLVRVTDGKAVAAKTFRISEAATGTEVGTVSEAFSRALAKLDADVVAWTLAEGNRAGK
jgi:cholesterol transport system auxiliary component